VILEREALPGLHASGRNAAMVRQTALSSSIRAPPRGSPTRFSGSCRALASARVVRWWAGLRTRTDDGRFVLGRDVRVQGVGRLAAEAVLGGDAPADPAPDRAT
jgi:glycine/D-amino acid oxidase-like deaminating enzyme